MLEGYVLDEKTPEKLKAVSDFWNSRPCNIKHSPKNVGTREYFEEVTQRKYFVEKHILQFADFAKYKDKHVLEVGCGMGTAAQSFVEHGAIYTGLDISRSSIDLAKKRFEVFGLKGILLEKNIEETNNINDQLYDLVYSFGVLHHTPNTALAVDNIYKMLKPGGEFKLMLYARRSLKYFEIESGLEQFEAQNGVPIADVYTDEEVHSLLKAFKNVTIWQTHIFPFKVEQYKNYIYEKKDHFHYMPQELFDCYEKYLGWHLCITCTK